MCSPGAITPVSRRFWGCPVIVASCSSSMMKCGYGALELEGETCLGNKNLCSVFGGERYGSVSWIGCLSDTMNVGDFPRSDSGGERGTPDALHHSGCRYQASTVCPPSSSGRFFLPVGSGEHRNWGSPRGKPPASQCNRKVDENMGVGTLKKLRGLCLRGSAPRTWAVGVGRSLALPPRP